MKIKKVQETPWGRIVSTETRIPIGSHQKKVLGLRMGANYPDYVHIEIVYALTDGRNYYADSYNGDAFALTDRTNNRLGIFPDRVAMTKWVKSHLVN